MQVAEVLRNQHAIISTEAPSGNEGRWAGSLMLWRYFDLGACPKESLSVSLDTTGFGAPCLLSREYNLNAAHPKQAASSQRRGGNCKKEKAKHANSHDDHQTAQTADKSRLLIPFPPVTDKIRHQ